MRPILSFYLLLLGSILFSQTYTRDIAPIIYKHCSTCHRPGEIGPFSLTNYEETKAAGYTIKAVTKSKYMPPWKADPSFQRYLDENYLTDDQIKLISDWVDKGMPYGNATEEPAFPDFPIGSLLGEPDTVLKFDKKHIHRKDNKDEYWYFVLPTKFTENKIIKAIELRPGNKKIVHHALFFQDTTGLARSFDNQTPEFGFSANTPGFGFAVPLQTEQYPGYVPGQKPLRYPASMGQVLNKGADLVIQMHYAPVSTQETDSSTVNIFFADEKEHIERIVKDYIMLPRNLPGGFPSFVMPPNTVKKFKGQWKVPSDISLLSVFPHMHLLGKKWKVWLERPDGSTENLIKIDDWDFNWQGGYYFKKFIIAKKNSIIHAEAEYDNTVNNPLNPNNPPKTVYWGENTTDEMYYLPILYVPYKAGDENIIFSDVNSTEDLGSQKYKIEIVPNPASDQLVNIGFTLENANTLTIDILDINGNFIKNITKKEYFTIGKHFVHLDPTSLANGLYIIKIQGKGLLNTEKLVITK